MNAALDLESSLLINSKSATAEKEDGGRIEKDNKALYVFVLLSPCSIDLWPGLCLERSRLNTKLLAILPNITGPASLQSAALRPFNPDADTIQGKPGQAKESHVRHQARPDGVRY